MSKYGKHIIFDCSTGQSREEEMTDEEKAAFDQREIDHASEQAVYAKVKYLDDRKRDPDYPTMHETQDAMLAFMQGDTSKSEALQARIKAIEEKYPAYVEPTVIPIKNGKNKK